MIHQTTCSRTRFYSLPKTHSNLYIHRNGRLANIQQIFIKLNPPLFKRNHNRRPAKLENTQFIAFVDITTRFLPILMYPKTVSQSQVWKES